MKALSRELLDRAVLAMVAAIEIYNKPGFSYRNESFAILAINAWELLLKAKWLDLNGNKKRSLYVYERRSTMSGAKGAKKYIKRTRSDAPFTHELGYLAKQLVIQNILDQRVSQNITLMLEFRDCATHFYSYNPTFYTRLYEIGAACVKNFVNAVDEWFQRDVTEFNVHLMPLTFMEGPSDIIGSLLNGEENSFLAFVDNIAQSSGDSEGRYAVSVNVELRFVRSKAKDAFSVQVTKDPSALLVRLTEEDIRERYPWDYATLTQRCRKRYKDFKENRQYHGIRKTLETNERFGHLRFLDPGNNKSAKKRFFNPNIIAELDRHYRKKEPSS